MFLVYLGLTYLGATVSDIYDLGTTRVNLVINIVHGLLGGGGRVIIAIVIAMACLTTAIALISSASTFFASLINKKGSYLMVSLAVVLPPDSLPMYRYTHWPSFNFTLPVRVARGRYSSLPPECL